MQIIRNNSRKIRILSKLRLKWTNYKLATGKSKTLIKKEIDELDNQLKRIKEKKSKKKVLMSQFGGAYTK